MTYNKTTWKTGDVITQEKLNHIEDGIGDSLDVDTSNISNLGKSNLSGLSMPSDRYIDLTLGASGSTYTAPANGYFVIRKLASNSSYLYMSCGEIFVSNRLYSDNYIELFIPAKKGAVCLITYDAPGSTEVFRFVYAQGEV